MVSVYFFKLSDKTEYDADLLYKINEMYYSGEDMHEQQLKEGLPVKPIQDTEDE